MELSHNGAEVLNFDPTSTSGQINFGFQEKILQFGPEEKNQLKNKWQEILTCSLNPDLEIIIFKNDELTNDVLEDNIKLIPPYSLPGKLLAFLLHRFKYFNGASDKGLVILSVGLTDLETADLEAIILELAHLNNIEPAFLDWVENSNFFGNKKMLQNKYVYKK